MKAIPRRPRPPPGRLRTTRMHLPRDRTRGADRLAGRCGEGVGLRDRPKGRASAAAGRRSGRDGTGRFDTALADVAEIPAPEPRQVPLLFLFGHAPPLAPIPDLAGAQLTASR